MVHLIYSISNHVDLFSIIIKMKISTSILTVVICLFTTISFSQKKNVDSLSYPRLTKFPLAETSYTYFPNTTFIKENKQVQIDVKEWKNSLFIPLTFKNKKTTLLNKVEYNFLNFKSVVLSENFHTLKYRFILLQKLNPKWTVAIGSSPTLATDFNTSTNVKDFYYEINTLALKRVNNNLNIGFGLTYSTIFGDGILVPVVTLTYKKDKWLTNLYLPKSIKQTYQINTKSNISIGANLVMNLYHVSFDQELDHLNLERILYSRINIGPQYQFQIFKDLYLNISGGFTYGNSLERHDNQFNTINSYPVKNGSFIQVSLRVLK